MRKRNIFILLFLIVIMLNAPLNIAHAQESYTSIKVVLNKVNIAINGVTVGMAGMDYVLTDGSTVPYSILYNGTTYLPMRKVAELVGMSVSWDNATNTAVINTYTESMPVTIKPSAASNVKQQTFSESVISVVLNKINIAIDGSIVGKAGMNYTLANGEQVPYSILYKGTTYLPMRKVAELVGKEVVWNSAANTAEINDIIFSQEPSGEQEPVPPEEPEAPQIPRHQEEIKPAIEEGQALLKINFKLPEGSVMNSDEIFCIMCDTVSSNGTTKSVIKNILMMNGSNLFTAYIPVDASGGSASCRVYYLAFDTSGYLNGMLTDKGTEMLHHMLSAENDTRKVIEVKEGSMAEVTLDAIKGVLFTSKVKVTQPDSADSEQNLIGIQFIEMNREGDLIDCSISYYTISGKEDEIDLKYTFNANHCYSLAFCDQDSTFYYLYGDIAINDEAIKTGMLEYQPIEINFVPEKIEKLTQEEMEQMVQEKVKDIISRIIKPGMSEIDKEYAIFKYVQNNTIYGFSANCGNEYGCLIENVSVCEGYARAIKRLLDAAGIENQIAYGEKGNDDEYRGAHAWNIVKIGNEYYHLDALHNRFNLNDAEAKREHYAWEEGSIPQCNSRFSIPQGLSFFVHDGYIYYTSGSFYFEINRCKPDGIDDIKLFTTKNEGSYFFQKDGWIYYFRYEGNKVYKVRIDGSEETLIYTFENDVRIHKGDISGNAIYFFAQTGPRGEYKKEILKLDIESLQASKIAIFDEYANMWRLGDHFYYYRKENGEFYYYRMNLDGTNETRIY